jgi:hypothetical protein
MSTSDEPRLLRLLFPPWLLVASLALSICAWAIPWGPNIHTGFADKLEITWGTVLVLGSWYLLIILTGALGFALGRRFKPVGVIDDFPDRPYYLYFSVIGAIGVVYTYGSVFAGDPGLIVDAVRNQTFNDVRLAIPYGPGIQTLRYATILAGGIAFYEVCLRWRFTWLGIGNLALLALAAAAASRLSLLMAILIAVGLAVKERPRAPRLGLRVLALAGIGFVALTAFNYLRNANFYEQQYGTTNPLTMNLDESVAYLGAPFQASIAEARGARGDAVETLNEELVPNPGAETDALDWVTYDGGEPPAPTFERVDDPALVAGGTWAFSVGMANPSSQLRDKFVWTSDRASARTAPGDRFRLRAVVTGPASRDSPIRLGVRVNRGPVTQERIAPLGDGVTLIRPGKKSLLEGEYEAPDGVTTVQLAVWKERIAPGTAPLIGLDDASFVRLETAAAPRPPLYRSLSAYLIPSYLAPTFEDVVNSENDYRRHAEIDSELTANSAFAAMHGSLGTAWAYVIIAIACLLGAMFAGHASRYKSHFFLGVFVISYVFTELWRIYLFNFGIIQFLLLVLVLVPFCHPYVVAAGDRLRSRLK